MRSRPALAAAAAVDASSGLDERTQLRLGLDALVEAEGAAPVDEDEERRLAGARSARDHDWAWSAELLARDGRPVAYVGTRIAPDTRIRHDVTLARQGGDVEATATLAAVLASLAARPGRVEEELWLRGATADDLALAEAQGFRPRRRLQVLGVDAAGVPSQQDAPDWLVIEPSTSDDDVEVGALLAAAYPLAEGGWDAEALAVRRASDWFRREDVLVARSASEEDAPSAAEASTSSRPLLGVHWMKRRGPGVGEVHNLAVHPQHQGRGVGPALLDAGLAHLFATGCDEVLLWVDADNVAALELYRSRGFAPRWDDVAVQREGR
jgi:mycothiol synthase